jgi:nitroimidazol reductase NimA-like FMN-containing flavoprotein (pyridoxamine 5'-phosphate oxidase superfamily)
MSYERRLEELTKPQSLELMSSVPVGRLVFVYNARPAIRPVNHVVEGDTIIVRATVGSAIIRYVEMGHRVMDVAYEADAIDTARQLGWSVIVAGTARLVTDRAAAARYRTLIEPWVAGPADDVILISADNVHGYRMVPGGLLNEGDPAVSVTGKRLT